MYTLGIYILGIVLNVVSIFNKKIRLGVKGRQQTFKILNTNLEVSDKTIWFHCASLGEYEQGLPVFEAIRATYKSHKIILTFFSPSGYEIRKNSKIADLVVYLPLDTPSNARQFLDVLQPELTVFVKYDIWPNFLSELRHQKGRAILISALFRKNQPYFKWYGNNLRNALKTFEHIFVQNAASKQLLSSIEINNVTISGDTRYDRVSNQLKTNNSLDFISDFKANSLCIVIGSSWPEDEDILIPYINANASEDLKFIIAPHNVGNSQIEHITKRLQVNHIRYSELETHSKTDAFVFIVDTIGLLSKIYSDADIAYVGGGMGTTGLHNILEPAVFGIPIVIGKNYSKFPEATLMIKEAGVSSVNDLKSLSTCLNEFISSEQLRKLKGELNSEFINKNKGAVIQILDYLRI